MHISEEDCLVRAYMQCAIHSVESYLTPFVTQWDRYSSCPGSLQRNHDWRQ